MPITLSTVGGPGATTHTPAGSLTGKEVRPEMEPTWRERLDALLRDMEETLDALPDGEHVPYGTRRRWVRELRDLGGGNADRRRPPGTCERREVDWMDFL